MLESEAGARLKAFLAGKLQGSLRKCYQAIIKNHRNIEAENMKNNDNAKKVGLLLEKLARGIVHRQFSGFVRFWNQAKEERAAEAALAERLGMMDEMNKAKLRVFLDGKRLGKLSVFYSHWKNIWMNRDLIELYDRLTEEEELKKKAEEELERLRGDQGAQGDANAEMEARVADAKAKAKQAEVAFRNMHNELRKLQQKIKDLERDLEDEAEARAEGRAKLAAVRAEVSEVTAQRDALQADLMGMAGEVSNVHAETEYDE
jgi:chromosome segregation ATPase